MTAGKTPGQLAYEEDCQRMPRYVDGAPRPPWDRISPLCQSTWHKNPTPREWKTKCDPIKPTACSSTAS